MNTESIVGKMYMPYDNSFEHNFTNTYSKKSYLAGTSCTKGVVVEIISEPFNLPWVISPTRLKNELIVFVRFEDQTFTTSYREDMIIK